MAHHRDRVHAPEELVIYYCLCGEFVLVCNQALETLPTRPMDGAHVLRCLDSAPLEDGTRHPAQIYKISASQGASQMIKRPDGSLEHQYDFQCTRCGLLIGYEHTPPPLKSGGKFTYIFPGALTYVETTYHRRKQGVVPPNALSLHVDGQATEA